MSDIRIVDLRDKTEIKEKAAEWFHSKWGAYGGISGVYEWIFGSLT